MRNLEVRRMGLRLIAASVAVGLVGLSGCNYHSKKDTYFLISNNQKLPYWKSVNEGFSQAATEYGVTSQFAGPDNFDPQGELTSFTNAVAVRPAGILISVADANLLRPEINTAIAAGVPVITVDSDAPLSNRLYFIGTDNVAVGHLGGQRLVDELHGKGNIVFYTITGQPNLQERLKGYMDVIAEHPGIKVVDAFDTKGDPGASFDQTELYMSKTGADKVDAFVCLESSSGKSIAEVLKRKSAKDRLLIAMDVDPDTLSLIKDGTIAATISQKPYTMGYVGLKQLDEIHHNHPASGFQNNYAVNPLSPYPLFIDTGTAVVDKNNVDLYIGVMGGAK